ncbi:TolC family protein [Cupriavidus basilensis]
MLFLNAGESGAIDLVGSYQQALAHDPTSLAASDALTAGREMAVQGDALLRPRVSLQAALDRINNRSSGNPPAEAAPLVSADSSGTARQAGVMLIQPLYDRTAVATRKQLREQSNLAQTQFDQSRQNLALRVGRGVLRRGIGRGNAPCGTGREGGLATATGPRQGALRHRPGQDHQIFMKPRRAWMGWRVAKSRRSLR